MAYPIFVALVGISTIVFMLVFVMPRIINLFGTLGQTLPVPTRIIIGISNILREQWIFVLLGLLVTFFLLVEFSKTQAHKRLISFVSLNVPGVRNFARMLEFAHFSRTMELLVKNGIPILNALELAIYTISNDIIKHRLAKSYRDLKEGSSFGRSLKGSKIFPAFMVNLIIVGEESGRLEEAFGEIASTYERDTNEAMKTLISLFEPVMILIMGLIVGFVVIAMLLPIFEINLMAR
jgi:type II secretory pathway component PulF